MLQLVKEVDLTLTMPLAVTLSTNAVIFFLIVVLDSQSDTETVAFS